MRPRHTAYVPCAHVWSENVVQNSARPFDPLVQMMCARQSTHRFLTKYGPRLIFEPLTSLVGVMMTARFTVGAAGSACTQPPGPLKSPFVYRNPIVAANVDALSVVCAML